MVRCDTPVVLAARRCVGARLRWIARGGAVGHAGGARGAAVCRCARPLVYTHGACCFDRGTSLRDARHAGRERRATVL